MRLIDPEDLAAVADHIASGWDDCIFVAVGGGIDVGAAIRASLERTRNVEHTAQQWDGCMFQVGGEDIDVGQAIRNSFKSVPEPGQAAGPAI